MPSPRTRATRARVAIDASLRASMVHLPASLCTTLLAREVVPQTLIVELGTEAQTYYGGWTGLSASASVVSDPHKSDKILLGPVMAGLFSPPLRDDDELTLRLFRSPPVPVAQEVHVTPLSPDDWEMLSVHADEVESQMLAQVRAAKQGQVLAVAVGRSAATVLRFHVDRTVPPTRALEPEPGASDDAASIAVRLSNDTEVIIAPRDRKKEAHAAQGTELDVGAADADADTDADAPLTAAIAQAALADMLWRVLPSSAHLSGLDADERDWAVVVPAALAPPSARRPSFELVARAFTHGKLCITKAPCPTTAAQHDDAEAAPAATASAAFWPGAPPAMHDELAPELRSAAPATPPISWPAHHLYLGPALRAKLEIRDGDVVTFSPPPPGAVRDAAPRRDTGCFLHMSPRAPRAGMEVLAPALAALQGLRHARHVALAEQGRLDELGTRATPTDARAYAGPSGLLLTGPSGCGKTSVAYALGEAAAADPALLHRTMVVDCAQYAEERLPLVRARFKEWLDDAAWHAPTLLVLDNLDVLVPAESEQVDAWRAGHLARALALSIQDAVRDFDVVVLATAQASTSVHAHLVGARLWTQTLAIKPPSKDARAAILQHLVQDVARKGELAPPDLDVVALTGATDGYHAADLQTLVERAVHEATIRCLLQGSDVTLSMPDFERARDGYTPLALRAVSLQTSSTNWADIGGLHAVRRTLRETIEWPTKYAPIFAKCPLRLRSGLLLYGYPGCGKTLLASAVAKECGLNFISVKGPEILNKYIGASEKSVRDLFERAQAAKPCVLFFDEFDSIAPKRGHDSTGVTDRVVNQMLTQMDGAEGLDGVYVLAATSRPDLIDAALLRPGRLDKSLLCDMPSLEDRADILEAVARSVPVAPDVDLRAWARRTEGFSGADLQALLYNAHLETISAVISADAQPPAPDEPQDERSVHFVRVAPDTADAPPPSRAAQAALSERLQRLLLHHHGDAEEDTQPAPASAAAADHAAAPRHVTNEHLARAIATTRPSVPEKEVARLRRIYQAFAGDRDGAFPDGSAPNEVGARTSLM